MDSDQTVSLLHPVDISFTANEIPEFPYEQPEPVAVFRAPSGKEHRASGFWNGEREWMVRFAPDEEGTWSWACEGDARFERRQSTFAVGPANAEIDLRHRGFLTVHKNRRVLAYADGSPFFWLADTVWAVPSKATVEEWSAFCENRKTLGFSVMEMNAMVQHDASGSPSRREPFLMSNGIWDPRRLDVTFFQYLDKLIEITVNANLVPVLTAIWFDVVKGTHPEWNINSPFTFTPEQARRISRYLAARYGAWGTVWFVSADTDYETDEVIGVYRATVEGLREGSACRPLLSMHLAGVRTTSPLLNAEEWLDFHTFQTGHGRECRDFVVNCAQEDYRLAPPRPIVNGEGLFDGIGYYREPERADRQSVRAVLIRGFLSGAVAGMTYGAHGIWSWTREGEPFADTALWQAPYNWDQAMALPSAADAQRVAELLRSLPQWHMFEPLNEKDAPIMPAAALPDRTCIIAYTEEPRESTWTVDPGRAWKAEWFFPATGQRQEAALSIKDSTLTARPYTASEDAILVLQATDHE